eukprot:11316218-Ditylum_brightwellii.AAC.1
MKGNLADPNKWRPVCLLETSCKVLASILANRINPLVRDHGLDSQCRSLNFKGCANALLALKSAIQTRREHNLATHILFVDLVKAFDTVNHLFLMQILRKFGIPETTVDVICCMYRDFCLIVSVGKASETIPYTIGVHQGNKLAPLLFNLFFQAALKSLEHFWQTKCIPVLQFCWFPTCKMGDSKAAYASRARQKAKVLVLKNCCTLMIAHFFFAPALIWNEA